jgi:GMP synthase (glutamine-hydrolysing)
MQKIAVLDFGGQYAHLIANRVRRMGVYAEIVMPEVEPEALQEFAGIILSGGPQSVYGENAPTMDKRILELGLPVLGICYGHQLVQHLLGGHVSPGTVKEYGMADMEQVSENALFADTPQIQRVWMSHGDYVEKMATGFHLIGSTKDCETAAIADEERRIYGVQFHPEVVHTEHGMKMLENFIFNISKAEKSWDMQVFYKNIEQEILHDVGDKNVFLLVSGGVDSSVLFTLLNKVLGPDRVRGVLIDHGLMRLNESDQVITAMKSAGYNNLSCVHAEEEFLSALKGITDPEEKRNIIGRVFVHMAEKIMMEMKLDNAKWLLAQGTIYPDTIETGGTKHADKIKTHHNRVQEIQDMIDKGLVIEPLKQLYKDEVRSLGEMLGLPEELLMRHPFPGPGLAIRTLCVDINDEALGEETEFITTDVEKLPIKSVGVQGDARTYAHPAVILSDPDYETLAKHSTALTNQYPEINRVLWKVSHEGNWHNFHLKTGYITGERLEVLKKVDDFITKRLRETGWYDKIWQCPVVLIPFGDMQESIVLRPINSKEAMTAEFSRIEQGVVVEIAREIIEKFPVEAVFYDITNKPPATIEWE